MKTPNTFKALRSVTIDFVRVPGPIVVTAPRATGELARGREPQSSANRGGFVHGGLRLATDVTKGKVSIYLPVRDVHVRGPEWEEGGGFGWTNLPIFSGPDFKPVNPVIEVRVSRQHYHKLLHLGLADPVPNDDVAHNLVKLNLTRLPVMGYDAPDDHYVHLKREHAALLDEITWARNMLAASRKALLKQFGSKAGVLRNMGLFGASLIGFRIKLKSEDGTTADAVAEIPNNVKHDSVRVDIPYLGYGFALDPAPVLKTHNDSTFRFRIGNKPYEYMIDGLFKLASKKRDLEQRYLDRSIRLAEREYGILYNRGDRTEWDVSLADGTKVKVNLDLSQRTEAKYVTRDEAERWKATHSQS